MKKIIAIGFSKDYDSIANALRFECAMGNISICGFYMPGRFHARTIDGIPLLTETELVRAEFDYLLVFSEALIPLSQQLCAALGRTRRAILPSRILSVPGFDFGKYFDVYESDVSIVSNHCWGGFLYHTLGMEFSSPFVNLFFSAAGFIRLVSDPDAYLNLPLAYLRDEQDENAGRSYPVMALGDIELHFNHNKTPEEAAEVFYRRRQRFNPRNLLYECLLDTPEDAGLFAKLPFPRKLGFAPFEYDHPDIIDIRKVRGFYAPEDGPFFAFVNSQSGTGRLFHLYNVLDLLLGEPDYMRIE